MVVATVPLLSLSMSLFRVVFLLLLFLVTPIQAVAQFAHWKTLSFPDPTETATKLYFWDANHGVVASEGALYWTEDGKNLVPANTPTSPVIITCLQVTNDRLFAVNFTSGTSKIWESTDRGKNWLSTGTTSNYRISNLYILPNGYIQPISEYGVGLYQGTWVTRISNTVLAKACDDAAPNQYSLDGGVNWISCSPGYVGVTNGGYSIVRSDVTGRLYTSAEKDQKGIIGVSLDSGVTWSPTTLPTNDFFASDVILGKAGVMYVYGYPTSDPSLLGLYRTTDETASWVYLGNVMQLSKTSFDQIADDFLPYFVGGCKGQLVVAAVKHQILVTDDGGDGTLAISSSSTPVEYNFDYCSAENIPVTVLYHNKGSKVSFGTTDSTNTFLPKPVTYFLSDSLRLNYTFKAHGHPGDRETFVYYKDTTYCEWSEKILVHTTYDYSIGNTSPLRAYACTDTSFQLTLHAGLCNLLRVDSILSRSDQEASVGRLGSTKIDPGKTVVLPITYTYDRVGTDAVTLHVIGSYQWDDSTLTPFDSTFVIPITIVPTRTPLRAVNSFISLQSLTTCRPYDTSVIIHNISCDPIKIVTIKGLSADWTLSGLQPNDQLQSDSSGKISLHFSSTVNRLVKEKLTVVYETSNGRDSLLITLDEYVHQSRGAIALAADSLVTLATACGATDTTVTIKNVGCVRVDLRVASFPRGWTFDFPGGNTLVSPDSSIILRAHFSSVTTGDESGRAYIRYNDGGIEDSIALQLFVHVNPGVLAVGVPKDTIDAGIHTICNADTTIEIAIPNQSCDSVRLILPQTNGIFSFVSNDTTIPANGVAKLKVVVHPTAKGVSFGSLAFQYQDRTGSQTLQSTIYLRTTIIGGSGAVTASLRSIQVRNLQVCEERDTTILLTNTGCDSICITAADASGKGIAILNGMPICLAAGESTLLRVHVNADTAKGYLTYHDSLRITAAGVAISSIYLDRSIHYPEHAQLQIVPGAAQRDGTIRYLLENVVPMPPSATEMQFTLTYNDDLLSYLRAEEPDVAENGVTKLDHSIVARTFLLSPIPAKKELATFVFQPFVTATDQSTISVSDIQFHSNLSRDPGCLFVVDPSINTSYVQGRTCFDSTLRHFMGSGLILSVVERAVDQPVLRLTSEGLLGEVHISLYDVLGKPALDLTARANDAHSIDVDIPARSLAGGTYYARVISGGSIASAKIVIRR